MAKELSVLVSSLTSEIIKSNVLSVAGVGEGAAKIIRDASGRVISVSVLLPDSAADAAHQALLNSPGIADVRSLALPFTISSAITDITMTSGTKGATPSAMTTDPFTVYVSDAAIFVPAGYGARNFAFNADKTAISPASALNSAAGPAAASPLVIRWGGANDVSGLGLYAGTKITLTAGGSPVDFTFTKDYSFPPNAAYLGADGQLYADPGLAVLL